MRGRVFPVKYHALPARSLLKHELLGRVDGPVVPLARPAQRLGQLDEALVQAEVVAHGVLPALQVLVMVEVG